MTCDVTKGLYFLISNSHLEHTKFFLKDILKQRMKKMMIIVLNDGSFLYMRESVNTFLILLKLLSNIWKKNYVASLNHIFSPNFTFANFLFLI